MAACMDPPTCFPEAPLDRPADVHWEHFRADQRGFSLGTRAKAFLRASSHLQGLK
jgi:hypothetical protein